MKKRYDKSLKIINKNKLEKPLPVILKHPNKPKISRKRIFSVIIILVIILLLIISILLIQLNIINNPFLRLNAKPKLFVLKDECSLIVGQLIHNIKDEDSCRQICKSNCEVRNLDFYSSEFKEITGNCNECNCYCE